MKTMKLLSLLFPLIIAGCTATTTPTYQPPAANQPYAILKTNSPPLAVGLLSAVAYGALAAVAIVPSSSYTLGISKVDGVALSRSSNDNLIHISPGPHTIEVYCMLGSGQGCGSKTIKFNAVAGHSYLATLAPPSSGVDFGAASSAYIRED
ncbi:MAG: hypothetical protein ACK4PR_07250 [Gammaproteobacteria bacterium]